MDSDEDEEFNFGEAESIRQTADRHSGKLNEILSEVERRIPSLEFNDDDDENVDIHVWTPTENVPSFYKQFTYVTCEDDGSLSKNQVDEQIAAVALSSSLSNKTDNDTQHDLCTANALQDKTNGINGPSEIPHTSLSSSLILCDTGCDPLFDEAVTTSDELDTINTWVDKKPITSPPSSSSATSSCYIGSYSQCDNHLHTSDAQTTNVSYCGPYNDPELYKPELVTARDARTANTSIPDSKNIDAVASLTCSDTVVSYEKTVSVEISNNDHMTGVNPLSLLPPPDCNQVIHSTHLHGNFQHEHPSVSLQPSSCRTDNDESIPETPLPTTFCEKVVSHTSLSDEQISCSTSLCPSFPCQKGNNCSTESESAYVEMHHSRGTNTQSDEDCKVLDNDAGEKTLHRSVHETESGDQLDFNALNEINFGKLQSALETLSLKHVPSLSDLLSSSLQQEEPNHTRDAELMLKLSDLSKDQLNACSSVQNISSKNNIKAEGMHQKKRKVKGNHSSTKAIHTWSQLSNEDTSSQEPQTIFLDLRPETTLEKEKEEEEYSESIQRILGLNKERSNSLSDDESDDDLNKWREMRSLVKERAKKQRENDDKPAHTHSSRSTKVTRKPGIPNTSRAMTAPLFCSTHDTTTEWLHDEELTGGLSISTPHVIGAVKNPSCTNGNDEVTQKATTTEDSSSASQTGKPFQSDMYKAQDFIKTVTKGVFDVELHHEPIEAQNFHHTHANNEFKIDNKSAEGLTAPTDPDDARTNISHKDNEKSASDNVKLQKHNEEDLVVACGNVERLDSTKSYISQPGTEETIPLDERIASCCEKSEEKLVCDNERDDKSLNIAESVGIRENDESNNEETSSISTANIRIRLQLGESRENNDEVTAVVRNSFMAGKGKKNKANTKSTMRDDKEAHVKPLTTDESMHAIADHEHGEAKTGYMNQNGQFILRKRELSKDALDICDVYRIIDQLKENQAKQSQNSKPTPNISENNPTAAANMATLSACSMESTKPQKQRSQKQLRKLKEKLRINIENMRPTVTASGKYPAAYNTPVIYDQEASFEQYYQGLLPSMEEQVSLLLVVTLTACGEINHQYSKGKTLGSGSEVNHYFALLAWLLYLDGPYHGDDTVPFSVVAMHQACQNGLLQLFVGVQPNEKVFHPNAAAGRGSKKNKTRAFHKAISKYLSTHSLQSVYGNCQVDENSYSSKVLSTFINVGQDSNAVRRVFNSKPGFYWETVEIDGSNEILQSSSCDVNVENTVVFVRAPLYYHPPCVLDLLTRIENEGCDVAGLALTNEYGSTDTSGCYNAQHTLALAVRGPLAITKMKKIIGCKIPLLDDRREIPSLRSLYCSTDIEYKLFYCPSYSNQAATQLARVFGGRLTEDDIARVEESNGKPRPCSPDLVPAQTPPALLVSSTRVAFYLVISPLVPSSFLGELLQICFLRGFVLHGMCRVPLSKRQGASLGLSQLQCTVFCPLSGDSPFQSPSQSPPGSPARGKANLSLEVTLALTKITSRSCPSTILILQRENGLYLAASLVNHIFRSLKEWMEMKSSYVAGMEEISQQMYFTVTQFNDANTKSLWADICYKPDSSLLKRARNTRFSSNSEMEQICVLSSVNEEAIQRSGIILKHLYSDSNPIAGNWELLGAKSFPILSLVQAREVTPYEVGDRSWQSSVKRLMSATVFVFVFRGINIIQRLRDFMIALAKISSREDVLPHCVHEDWWISQTTEVAYRQLCVLFEEHELFSDETNRTNINYVPPLRQRTLQNYSEKESKAALKKRRWKWAHHVDHKTCSADESSTSVETTHFSEIPIIQSLLVSSRPLPTVALIKPSCLVNTKKISKIFKSILQENFDIVALRMRVLTQSESQVLVRDDQGAYSDHIHYLTSGASLLMCLQRENAVKKLLDILGPEDPVIARSLDPFLLRGSFGIDCIHNAIYGSESYSSAICKLKMLFPCGVCCEQTVDLEAEQIPCRAFDATIGAKPDRKITKCLIQSTDIANSLISSLVQVNCLILTHHVVYGRSERKRIAFVDVLECLFATNFVPVGMKMVMLSREQVKEFLMLIGSKPDRKHVMEKELAEGPCIILALQRDNAITCFDSIIESVTGKWSLITEHRKHIVEAQTEEEARNFLLYFFDGLAPNSVEQICAV